MVWVSNWDSHWLAIPSFCSILITAHLVHKKHIGLKVFHVDYHPYPSSGSPFWLQEVATSESICMFGTTLNYFLSPIDSLGSFPICGFWHIPEIAHTILPQPMTCCYHQPFFSLPCSLYIWSSTSSPAPLPFWEGSYPKILPWALLVISFFGSVDNYMDSLYYVANFHL